MPAYSAAVLADTPALYWRLGDESGPVADSSGNGRVGTVLGATLGVAGAISDGDPAASFDGVDDKITSTYSTDADGAQRTFECWAWRDSTATIDVLMSGTGGTAWWFYMLSGSLDVRFTPLSGEVTWTAAFPGVGQWVHLVLTFDEPADVAELYVNGVSQGTRTQAATWGATGGDFQVGGYSSATDHAWLGAVDEVAVYESILTSTRIEAHYVAAFAPPEQTAIWPYNRQGPF